MPTQTTARPLPLALWLAAPILATNLAISLAAFASTATVPLDVLLAGGGEALIPLALFLGLSDLLLVAVLVLALRRLAARLPLAGTRRPRSPTLDRRHPAGPFLRSR